jgi:hypothetical protein
MNIVQLNKVVEASCGVGNVFGAVLADGKVNMLDLPQLFSLLQAVQRFADVKFSEALVEVKELSEEEKKALLATFKASLDLPQDKLEGQLEKGLELALSLYSAILGIYEFSKGLKSA